MSTSTTATGATPPPPATTTTETAKSTTQEACKKIILIGDSLTQLAFEGWGSTLANVYQRRADVINRGCSGYNTKFYIQHTLPTLDTYNNNSNNSDSVALVTIWFGANDASIEQYNPRQYVSIDEYKQNLKYIISTIQEKYNKPNILLITPPPVVHEQRLQYQKQRYGTMATGILERTIENTGLYAKACIDVGNECTIPVFDIYNIMLQQDRAIWITYFYDGLHFSKIGHDYVAQQLILSINQNFPLLKVTPDPITGQYNNSTSSCPSLVSWGQYHEHIN